VGEGNALATESGEESGGKASGARVTERSSSELTLETRRRASSSGGQREVTFGGDELGSGRGATRSRASTATSSDGSAKPDKTKPGHPLSRLRALSKKLRHASDASSDSAAAPSSLSAAAAASAASAASAATGDDRSSLTVARRLHEGWLSVNATRRYVALGDKLLAMSKTPLSPPLHVWPLAEWRVHTLHDDKHRLTRMLCFCCFGARSLNFDWRDYSGAAECERRS
jgi:hypothetical protein